MMILGLRQYLSKNEVGDAELLCELFKDRFTYDLREKRWYEFTGHFWIPTDQAVIYKALDTVMEEYNSGVQGALRNKDQQLSEQLTRRAYYLGTERRRTSVVKIARSLGFAMEGEWDAKRDLLGCQNGVLDMGTGGFRPGAPGDYIRTVCNAYWYGDQMPCPNWEDFVLSIMGLDPLMAGYLQRLFGYALSGRCSEHILPVLWGTGRNGKSTLLDVLGSVLGPLADTASTEVLVNPLRAGTKTASPEILALQGKRIIWASETDEGRQLNAGKIKWITGGDKLTGRALYSNEFISFHPTHTFFLLTNYKPKAGEEDFSLWSRVHLIPFKIRYVEDPQEENEMVKDPDLNWKLKEESSGILSWMFRGWVEYQKYGLSHPHKVVQATEDYRKEEERKDDRLNIFLNTCCELNPEFSVRARTLYNQYVLWCARTGSQPPSETMFGSWIKERLTWTRDAFGRRYTGIKIREQYADMLSI